jgi:hypothetical protein
MQRCDFTCDFKLLATPYKLKIVLEYFERGDKVKGGGGEGEGAVPSFGLIPSYTSYTT